MRGKRKKGNGKEMRREGKAWEMKRKREERRGKGVEGR